MSTKMGSLSVPGTTRINIPGKSRMKKLVAVFGVAVALLATGCEGIPDPEETTYGGSSAEEGVASNETIVQTVEIERDGIAYEVGCVFFYGYRAGGLSCDWDHARER